RCVLPSLKANGKPGNRRAGLVGGADRDPAHPAVCDIVADLEAEGLAIEGHGCVRVVMREELRVNGDVHGGHSSCGSVTGASRFLIGWVPCFATHDGAGEVETPLHPARAGLRAPLGSLHQTEKLEQLLRASSRRGARDPAPAAPQLARRRGLSREAISWIADPRHKLRARRDSSQAPRCPLIGRPRTYHGGAWRAT